MLPDHQGHAILIVGAKSPRTLQPDLPGFFRAPHNPIPPAAFGLVKRDAGCHDNRCRRVELARIGERAVLSR